MGVKWASSVAKYQSNDHEMFASEDGLCVQEHLEIKVQRYPLLRETLEIMAAEARAAKARAAMSYEQTPFELMLNSFANLELALGSFYSKPITRGFQSSMTDNENFEGYSRIPIRWIIASVIYACLVYNAPWYRPLILPSRVIVHPAPKTCACNANQVVILPCYSLPVVWRHPLIYVLWV
jgi:hypothetical protein